jgi:hypothetical protein
MPPDPIPERRPVGDTFTGSLLKIDDTYLLATASPTGIDPVASGLFVVRYGVRFLEKPFLSIVPGLLALDYGDMLVGDAAWDFLLNRSNLYPRADVVGYRNDGHDDMIPVKWLDLAMPFEVLIYTPEQDTLPAASVEALIAPRNADIPERILNYLPHYSTISDWQASKNTDE